MPTYKIAVIFNNHLCCFNKNNKWVFLLESSIHPDSTEFDYYLKDYYNLHAVKKHNTDDYWVITVQSLESSARIKLISFNKFINDHSDDSDLTSLCNYLKKIKNNSVVKLQYGLKNGKIICIWDIPETERGLKSNCYCPGCGVRLQARLGNGKKQKHFSHDNSKCNIAVAQQTALHLLAKEIIEEEKIIRFPAITVDFTETTYCFDNPHIAHQLKYNYNLNTSLEYKSEKLVKFDKVILEKRVSSIIPDVIVQVGSKECLIEIAVTHFIDEEKKRRIKEIDLPVLEIDLSCLEYDILDKDSLKDIIINNVAVKKWIHNPQFIAARQWASKEYETRINQINKEREQLAEKYKKEQQIAQFRRQQKENKRARCIEELRAAFIPKNYTRIINTLKNDSNAIEYYNRSRMYAENNKLPFFLNIPITGEFVFNCDRRIWQSAIFEKFVYYRDSKNNKTIELFYKKIECWIILYNKEFNINWHYTYKTIINGKTIKLLHDVIIHYLYYLHDLGFIELHPYDTYGIVKAPNTLIPPNKDFADMLKKALDLADETSNTVTQQIAEIIINISKNT